MGISAPAGVLWSAWTACKYGVRPTIWPGWRPGRSNSTGMVRLTVRRVESGLLAREQGLQFGEARAFGFLGHLRFGKRGGSSRARTVFEGKGAGEADFLHQSHGIGEILVGFPGVADDEVG